MLVLLSPTKQMGYSRNDKFDKYSTRPCFSAEAQQLNDYLKNINKKKLIELMKISTGIADKTIDYIQTFCKPDREKISALFAYCGTVFQSLDASSFEGDDLIFANKHLRILSGMYGILKPGDLVSPYRLEMKTPLINLDGDNLYHFWKSRITDFLINDDALKNIDTPIINLASSEYIKAVDKKRLKQAIISFHFKERVGNKVRTVGMYSKVARGIMARRIIVEKESDPSFLKVGETGGYCYDSQLSSDRDWIFVRDQGNN